MIAGDGDFPAARDDPVPDFPPCWCDVNAMKEAIRYGLVDDGPSSHRGTRLCLPGTYRFHWDDLADSINMRSRTRRCLAAHPEAGMYTGRALYEHVTGTSFDVLWSAAPPSE